MAWEIIGGKPLKGVVSVSGSKNAALPIICASLLAEGVMTLKNVPNLTDIEDLVQIIENLGCIVERDLSNHTMTINSAGLKNIVPDINLVSKLRASFLLAGVLLGKFSSFEIPFPGGCKIGTRPIDLHLKAFSALGARHSLGHSTVICSGELNATSIFLDFPSVGATENAILAAVSVKGKTTIVNMAEEPEIIDLIDCLNKMGAKIYKEKGKIWVIEGGRPLKGVEHEISPDRIEAGTWLILGAMPNNDITVENANTKDLSNLILKLEESGVEVSLNPFKAKLKEYQKINIETGPYPSFPTDLQPQLSVLATVIPEVHMFIENIFENRFAHGMELSKMGGKIKNINKTMVIYGGQPMSGSKVYASDLRAGAALAMAGTHYKGKTVIENTHYIERGYEGMIEKLRLLGAEIKEI